ncbi:hypothetical protein KQX54_021802 [Cotesia glomerata]|uniref:Uncharacterized protein n=1 Tax=Cotesia glomerata TaxID=32391 RepID=A0AAV7JAJ6_COTGL|nr:hypothetical protein KQX54_021802 [Cotesia glomerata]
MDNFVRRQYDRIRISKTVWGMGYGVYPPDRRLARGGNQKRQLRSPGPTKRTLQPNSLRRNEDGESCGLSCSREWRILCRFLVDRAPDSIAIA